MLCPSLLSISNSEDMKSFVKKLIGFAFLMIVPLILIYVVCYFQKDKKYSKDTVYVWGDSQMLQGLDVNMLSSGLSKSVVTSARHGGGVYDFLVSIEHVPEGSTCIIAFPECAFFRLFRRYNNRTGLEFHAIWSMYDSGAPVEDCVRAFMINRDHFFSCNSVFTVSPRLYPFAPQIEYIQPLSWFAEVFGKWAIDTDWRMQAYKSGVSQLLEKKCQVILIQFPFESQVESRAVRSVSRMKSERLKKTFMDEFPIVLDTIVLQNDSLLFHDLSHFNEVGARRLTLEILDAMQKDTIGNHFFYIQVG